MIKDHGTPKPANPESDHGVSEARARHAVPRPALSPSPESDPRAPKRAAPKSPESDPRAPKPAAPKSPESEAASGHLSARAGHAVPLPGNPERGIDPAGFAALEEKAFAAPWPASAFRKQASRFGWWAALGEKKLAFLYVQKILDEAEILRIAVHPEYRRSGLARTLWQAFLDDEGADLAMVHLEVAQSNQSARRFYEHLGFRVNGTRKDYYGPGDDALMMVWEKPSSS